VNGNAGIADGPEGIGGVRPGVTGGSQSAVEITDITEATVIVDVTDFPGRMPAAAPAGMRREGPLRRLVARLGEGFRAGGWWEMGWRRPGAARIAGRQGGSRNGGSRNGGSRESRQLRRAGLGLGVVAVLVAIFAGAGSRSGTAGAGASCGAGTSAPGVTGDKVHLGLLYADSGTAAADLPAVRAGVDARIGAANAAGGIGGRRIAYDWRDDTGTPAGNLLGSRELVERSEVFGLLEFTSAASGGAGYLADRGVPVVGLATEDVWARYSTMISFAATTATQIDTYGQVVATHGGTSAVLLRTGLSAGVAGAAERVGASLRAAGVNVVATLGYTPGADNVGDLARQVVASGADSVVTMLAPDALPGVLREIRDAGAHPSVVLALDGYDQGLLRTAGADLAGTLVPVYFRPVEAGGAPTARYLDAMRRYAPQVDDPAQASSLVSYIGTDLFLRGLQAAGPCPTRASFLAALRGLTRYDAGGLIAPTAVATVQRNPATCFSVLRVDPAGTGFQADQSNLCAKPLTPAL
jgi:branched-chain amino acid transport system substrate-binding protein